MLLGLGTELALALQKTSLTCFSCSSVMSNSTSDSGGLTIRILHSPNYCCLSASLLIGFRCWSMSSCKQLSVPLCFCPSSSLVTLKRFAIKTPPFLALATPPQQLAPPASHQCGHLYIVVLFLPNRHFFLTLWIFRPQSFFPDFATCTTLLAHSCLFIALGLMPLCLSN